MTTELTPLQKKIVEFLEEQCADSEMMLDNGIAVDAECVTECVWSVGADTRRDSSREADREFEKQIKAALKELVETGAVIKTEATGKYTVPHWATLLKAFLDQPARL